MTVEKARRYARDAHKGQRRKSGEPYFNHLERVASMFENPILEQVAYLHDVLEDTSFTDVDLLLTGFSEEVVETVLALTRRKENNETYFNFVLRIRRNPLAVKVKVADLLDNLSDLEEGSLKDKYRLAYFVLTGKRPPGYAIKAECHSDDYNVQVAFDAVPWFERVTYKQVEELAKVGWKNDYPADEVAIDMAKHIEAIADMFKYIEIIRKNPCNKKFGGFECAIDEEDAMLWLKNNEPVWYRDINKALEEEK